jgi:uncharacterized SAM-binding protein YcdF (DUF218 family)
MDVPAGRMKRLTGFVIAVAALAGVALALGFVGFARSAADATAPADPRAQGIVVLTGGSARIDHALELLVEGRGSRLLISGVNPAVSEKTLAETLGSGFGVALECCVDLGHAARDTIGNALETRKWAERRHFSSLLVVTSDYHMRRSMAELASAMPGIRLLAVPISNPDLHLADWWKEPHTFALLAREYGKYLLTVARLALTPAAPPVDTASAAMD